MSFKPFMILILLCFCFPCISSAASYGEPLASLDVIGVKLGMNPKVVEEVLKKYNPKFYIERKYRGSAQHELFKIESTLDDGVVPPGFLSGIEAEDVTSDSHELIWVYFSSSQNQNADNEEVVAVLRWKTYLTDYPQLETLAKNIIDKVGTSPTFDNFSSILAHNTGKSLPPINNLMWCFNQRGKFQSSTSIAYKPVYGGYIPWDKNSKFGVYSFMPDRISTDQPINMQLNIVSLSNNPLLVQGFTQIILDADKYYTSFVKGKEYVVESARQNIINKQKADAAASSRTEKF